MHLSQAVFAVVVGAALASAQSSFAEEPDSTGSPNSGVHDFSPLILPIPISDPAIGSGLALVGAGLYQVGEEPRPWITGVAGLYTSSKSYAFGVVQRAGFGGDKVRVQGGVGGGVFNVEFFGVGQAAGDRGFSIPITQKAVGGVLTSSVRVMPHLFAGVEYRYIDITTTIRFLPPPFPDMDLSKLELNSAVSALGLTAEYDTRDNEFGPRDGAYAKALWLRSDKGLGSDFDYSRVEANANWYHGLGPKAVIAWRVSGCWAGNGAPFYDICNYGSAGDLRGYTSGQYRDYALFAAQAEYRRQFTPRFGAVVFAGVGGVASDLGDVFDHPLPAAGAGIRFKASRQYDVNVGVDYAVGKDSEAFYFRIGEAF